ncbi:hypothetical protein QP943_02970 [Corynebacterium kefirresidentii]|jgi:hypothetical protein|uniref:Transcriptional regulator n=1 Tax=Corynebacterium kefirresidentii TaxID=1979527 RepID=A0ABT8Q2X1_9CORY|nr:MULTISPECIES: hypothetical protein [Corynebacterium]WKS53756.1 hypothetical protein NLL48_00935 [Corynebacterium tuberculostearicum]ERS46170.1 hypothetical protein HMPREF1282_02099 [Corynebacterium sp. KPL1856]ERS48511.1 hypothetical protein HMPREF1286_01329 [Corynebacterium sp. KPL1860]ERS56899.1 hypothetical protein HMPREF1264_00603 [Corynebacterium sp. KPL1821]ERS63074.1 hypothetical protein HMPREF1260_00250 [Corynebacterium sp. KPL1817]
MTDPDHRARQDMRAYLESQDVYCARPDFLDALIQLFQSIEKEVQDDDLVQG